MTPKQEADIFDALMSDALRLVKSEPLDGMTDPAVPAAWVHHAAVLIIAVACSGHAQHSGLTPAEVVQALSESGQGTVYGNERT